MVKCPAFANELDTAGWRYVVEVPSTLTVFTQAVQTAVPDWAGRAQTEPCELHVVAGEPGAQTVAAVAAQWLPTQWHTLTVAEGAQGPRTYQFAAARVWECRDGLPGRECWRPGTLQLGWQRTQVPSLECADRHAVVAAGPSQRLALAG